MIWEYLSAAAVIAAFWFLPTRIWRVLTRNKDLERRRQLTEWANEHGLNFDQYCSPGLNGLDFEFFRGSSSHGWENEMTGQWDGWSIRAFDYWQNHTDHDSSTCHTYSVVIVSIDSLLPKLELAPETSLTRLADRMGLKDFQVGSDELDRQYNIKTPNPAFAAKLLDEPMIEWLLTTRGKHRYATHGTHLLTCSDLLSPSDLAQLFSVATGFAAHIPDEVLERYRK